MASKKRSQKASNQKRIQATRDLVRVLVTVTALVQDGLVQDPDLDRVLKTVTTDEIDQDHVTERAVTEKDGEIDPEIVDHDHVQDPDLETTEAGTVVTNASTMTLRIKKMTSLAIRSKRPSTTVLMEAATVTQTSWTT